MVQEVHIIIETGVVQVDFSVAGPGGTFSAAYLHVIDTAPSANANVQLFFVSPYGGDYTTEILDEGNLNGRTDWVHYSNEYPYLLASEFKIRLYYSNPSNRRIAVTMLGTDSIPAP